MNCRSAEHLFSSYVEDELSQRERRPFEEHLAECTRCSTAVEELRTTVDLLAALPSYETGPAFEEEVMDRIRSGEALRPGLIEWLSEHLAPARLRPVFLTGAAACAVWIAVLVMNPMQNAAPGSGNSRLAQEGASGPGVAPEAGPTAGPAAPTVETPAAPTGDVIASATPSRGASGAGLSTAGRAGAARPAATASESADSARAGGNVPYQDEYILDQFYLNRSGEDGIHSIVPVTGRTTDDVYITF